jgi:Flp pilus assembly pilin Flp
MQTLRINTDDTGVTAIEYGLMAGLIAVVCLGALVLMGNAVTNLYAAWVVPALAAL